MPRQIKKKELVQINKWNVLRIFKNHFRSFSLILFLSSTEHVFDWNSFYDFVNIPVTSSPTTTSAASSSTFTTTAAASFTIITTWTSWWHFNANSGSTATSTSQRNEFEIRKFQLLHSAKSTYDPSSARTASSASRRSSNSTKAKPGGLRATQTFLNGPYLQKEFSISCFDADEPRFPTYTLHAKSHSR